MALGALRWNEPPHTLNKGLSYVTKPNHLYRLTLILSLTFPLLMDKQTDRPTYWWALHSLDITLEHKYIYESHYSDQIQNWRNKWPNTGRKSRMLLITFLSFHACASHSVSHQRGVWREARFFAYDIISCKTRNTHTILQEGAHYRCLLEMRYFPQPSSNKHPQNKTYRAL